MKTPLVKNDVEKARFDREKRKNDRVLSDMRFILKYPEGRRFLWKILAETKVFKRTFTDNNANATIFNEGRRSVGTDILDAILNAKPEAFSQMQMEHAADAKREEIEISEEIKQIKEGAII